MNFYKHHLGDYDGATAHLTWDEDMAYTRLLRMYYRREKPIPIDPGETYRLIRAQTRLQKEAITRVLHEFFDEREDGWHNKRADEEIAAYQAQCEVNRRVGKLGGRPSETEMEPNRLAKRNRTETEPVPGNNPNHKPLTRTINQEPKKHTGRKRPCVSLPENFGISENVKTWAQQKGFDSLEAHLENFVRVARAKGYVYADWDQAFMGAVAKDWAGLRANGAPVDLEKLVREIEEEDRKRAAN